MDTPATQAFRSTHLNLFELAMECIRSGDFEGAFTASEAMETLSKEAPEDVDQVEKYKAHFVGMGINLTVTALLERENRVENERD